MDGKFRLAFGWTDQTLSAQDYLGPDASVHETLRAAVAAAQAEATPTYLPFIAHRHMIFDPRMIAVLHAEFADA